MPENTIKATYELDTTKAKQSLDDIERHAQRHSQRMGGGGSGPRRPPSGPGGGGGGGGGGDGGIAGAVALGTLTGNAAVKLATDLGNRFVEVNTQAAELQTRIAGLIAQGSGSGHFQGIEEMRQSLSESAKEADQLRAKLAGFGGEGIGGKAVGSFAATMEALFRGMTPGKLREEMGKQIEELNKSASEQISKMATKSHELAKVEEERFRIGEREAGLRAMQIKSDEVIGTLAAEQSKTHKDNTSAIQEEKSAEEERVKQFLIGQNAADREAASRLRGSEIATKMAQRQKEITGLQLQGLTREQLSVATARQNVDVSQERLSLAENELKAAREQVEAAQEQGREEKRIAQERLQRATTGVEAAKGGIQGAAAGAAGAEEERLLRKGAEEEMSPAEKNAQYQKRVKQAEGLRHAFAREGKNTDLIDMPKYGEAEYDPLAKFRAVRGQEIEQQALQKAAQEKAQQQQQEQQAIQQQAREQENAGLLKRGGGSQVGVMDSSIIESQRTKERGEALQKPDSWEIDPTTGGQRRVAGGGTDQGMPAGPAGEMRADKNGEWIPADQGRGPQEPVKPWTPGVIPPQYNQPSATPSSLPSPQSSGSIEERTDQLIKQKHLQPSQAKEQAQKEAADSKPISKADLEQVMQRYWGKSS